MPDRYGHREYVFTAEEVHRIGTNAREILLGINQLARRLNEGGTMNMAQKFIADRQALIDIISPLPVEYGLRSVAEAILAAGWTAPRE